MKELVETIAKALVDNADHVQVRAIEGEQVIVFELRVHPSDLGKVIGRQGARPSPSAPSRVRRASVINNSKPFFPPSKEAAAMNMLGFDEAIKEIAETCREAKQQKRTSPFVFVVGAGISHPSVPLASEIEEECRKRARTNRLIACSGMLYFV